MIQNVQGTDWQCEAGHVFHSSQSKEHKDCVAEVKSEVKKEKVTVKPSVKSKKK
jgi:gas vesicle protein